MEISLFRHDLDVDQAAQLDRAISHFNEVQATWKIVDRGLCSLQQNGHLVEAYSFAKLQSPTPLIAVTGRRLTDNFFSHSINGKAVLTVNDWDISFFQDRSKIGEAAPDASILTSLALCCAEIVSGVKDLDILHEQTVGCLFDLCLNKTQRSLKMRSAYVCGDCQAQLSQCGVSELEVDALHLILEKVRELVLGRTNPAYSPPSVNGGDEEYFETSSLPEGVSIPPRLMEAAMSGDLTILVGSGLSLQKDVVVEYAANLGWNKLPTWSEVAERMAESLQRYRGIDQAPRETTTLSEFITDLEFFRSALGADLYYPRAVSDIFLPSVHNTGLANRLLCRIKARWIFTTNYDSILVCAASPGTSTYTWKEARQARELLASASDCKPIVKLHGCASRADTIVLTSSEYDGLKSSDDYRAFQSFVFSSHPVLFVGFGLTDPFDLEIAMQEARFSGAAASEQFAILPSSRADSAKEKFPNLQVVSYDSHDDIPGILAELVKVGT